MANRKYYPFDQMISGGYITGHSFNHKFGAVPSLSTNTTGTVWDVDDTLYPWTALDTPAVVNVERNNIADDGYTVTVQGLDADYNFVEDTIIINGADTLGTVEFKRVNRAFVSNGGSSNTGNIDIEAGAAGGTTVARITAGLGQTLMAAYTIPAGYTGYLMRLDVTAQGTATGSFKLFARPGGVGSFQLKHVAEVNGVGGPYQLEYPIPQSFPEKTDIDARMHTQSNNGRYTCTFDILLVDNTAGVP